MVPGATDFEKQPELPPAAPHVSRTRRHLSLSQHLLLKYSLRPQMQQRGILCLTSLCNPPGLDKAELTGCPTRAPPLLMQLWAAFIL